MRLVQALPTETYDNVWSAARLQDESVGTKPSLRILFDGRPEADALLKADGKTFFFALAADGKLLTIPAEAKESTKLAKHYVNALLGEIDVSTSSASTIFDFGEWKSEVASRKNPDGTISFITIVPGVIGAEFVVGSGPKRTLTIRDAQHEYVFEERSVPRNALARGGVSLPAPPPDSDRYADFWLP